jgi:hypothetical protein
MPTSFSTNLALALPATGELSGTWGTTVNSNITNMLDEALGYQAFTATGGSDTLTIPDGTTGVARSIYIQLNGTGGGTVNVPTAKTKMYFVFNNTSSAITFKVTSQTGVSIPAAAKIALVSNGTDIITAENYLAALTLGAALPVASGGTSLTTLTANNVMLGNGTSAPLFVAPSSSGNVLTSNGTTWASSTPATSGTVTSVSVVSANGLAGTVATATTTPAITLSTSITGVLKGNGTAISAATSGTDYLAPPSGTALLKANSGGALANATAGTDYVAPGTATTFTATQTFSGTSSVTAVVLNDVAEVATIAATAATGTINYDITTQAVQYFTSNASGNFTVNFRASSGTSLNTLMTTGQSMTVAFLVTNGATAYYNNVVQVDGSTVTPKWQGGTAPTSGNASSVDTYSYTIIKTGNAAFTVFASQTKFA